MSNNFVVNSQAMNLPRLRWNGFSITIPNTTYAQPVMPSFQISEVTTVLGMGGIPSKIVRFTVPSGVIPAWCIPGAAVNVSAIYGGVQVGCKAIVNKIDTDSGLWFEVQSNETISTELTDEPLDSNGTVTLMAMGQKFMLVASGGTINFAAVADKNGANPGYFEPIASGAAYELTAPQGAKFDFEDLFFAMASGSNGTLMVRFL